jgi:ribosome-binding protein aMBF1 (putative translation factor)
VHHEHPSDAQLRHESSGDSQMHARKAHESSLFFGISHMAASALRVVVATNVRLARAYLNLRQDELADRATLHRTFIGSLERGERNITIDNLERIASALGYPAWFLLNPDFNPKSFTSEKSSE